MLPLVGRDAQTDFRGTRLRSKSHTIALRRRLARRYPGPVLDLVQGNRQMHRLSHASFRVSQGASH